MQKKAKQQAHKNAKQQMHKKANQQAHESVKKYKQSNEIVEENLNGLHAERMEAERRKWKLLICCH